MRVLLVLEACSGGAGRHVVDLAGGLTARGHDVSLAYSPARAEPWFLNAISAVQGLVLYRLPMHRSLSFGDVGACRQLRRLVNKTGSYDILHGHSSKAGALLRLAQLGNHVPVVYTPHAPITMDPKLSMLARSAYSLAERMLAGLCARIICVSPSEQAHLHGLGLPARKLRVVCNGIAPLPGQDRAALREKLGLNTASVCFGFVGRITHQKAVDRVIAAFVPVCRQHANARLVIVGDGPELEAMQALAVDLGVAREVLFTGAANGAELMSAFDVFVLPSRYEGMPYVLLEAVANRLPVVMTDVGGAHLVVRDEENGFVVPQARPAQLSDHLITLAKQPGLRGTMAARSAEIAASFSLERMVDETLVVYQELVFA